MGKEIERKFLLKTYSENNYPKLKTEFIIQSYVSLTENAEVRIRKVETNNEIVEYTMAYKNGTGLVREEVEFEIDKDTYENLIKDSVAINKVRYYINIQGSEVSIDVYMGDLSGLIIAEVEFETEEEAEQFTPPSEFIEEVTNDNKYKNKNLWKKIQQKERF